MVEKDPFSRRSVLKTIGVGAGIGMTSVTRVGATSGDEVIVTTVKTNDSRDEDYKRKVPKKWYDQTKRSRKAADNLVNRLNDKEWYHSLHRVASDKNIDGYRGFKIEIESQDPSKARKSDDVPEKEEGVRVEVVDDPAEDPQPDACDCNTSTYSCIPGGALVEMEKVDGSTSCCTNSCIVQFDGSPAFVTAAHCFQTSCSDNLQGLRMFHGGEAVGEVDVWDSDYDFAVVRPYSDVEYIDTVVNEDPIVEHSTREMVEILVSNSQNVYRYGSTTCRNTGEVDSITPHFAGSCNGNVEAVRTTIHSEGGDSGGPTYQRVFDDTYLNELAILGAHWGSSPSYSWCPAAYDIASEYPINYGFANNCA